MGIRKSTQIKYWSIYEALLEHSSQHEVTLQFNCDRTTIWRAIKYCQAHRLDLSKDEDLAIMIEVKQRRLKRMYRRLDFLEGGWNEEKVVEKDGTILFTQVRGKFSPTAEAAFYREIRELEDDIEELKGLHDFKTRSDTTEEASEALDVEAIQRALDASDTQGEST